MRTIVNNTNWSVNSKKASPKCNRSYTLTSIVIECIVLFTYRIYIHSYIVCIYYPLYHVDYRLDYRL